MTANAEAESANAAFDSELRERRLLARRFRRLAQSATRRGMMATADAALAAAELFGSSRALADIQDEAFGILGEILSQFQTEGSL